MRHNKYSISLRNDTEGFPAYNEYNIYIDNICMINDKLCRTGDNGHKYFAPEGPETDPAGSVLRVAEGR